MILSRLGVDISFRRLVAPVILFASVCSIFAADPVVSNVKAKQREGSRLVDITYDVADPDSPTLTVYLKVSADGGKTWKGPVELVSGDVGQHIPPGTGKRLVWDAGKEMANQFGVKYRYRIGADDWQIPLGMALIPAGPFQMGDARVEGPVHTVTVSTFAIDKWEVPIELWESVRGWGNARGYDLVAGGSFGAQHPVHTVNWFDVVKWNNARSEKEGRMPAYYEDAAMRVVYRSGEKEPDGVKWNAGYRLPTEAEWEKAARGGAAGKLYPWRTDVISTALVNYFQSNKGGTMPVGSYGSYGYGLHDMAGNVWEWCWDWYGDYSQTAETDPRGPSSGSNRVIRGGSWAGGGAGLCRVADRVSYLAGGRASTSHGFRCVLPPGDLRPPTIDSQPTSLSIYSGSTATLTVSATGSAPFTYQWYRGNLGVTTGPVGINSPTFTTPALTVTTKYWVKISNAFGETQSTSVTVTVGDAYVSVFLDFDATLEPGTWHGSVLAPRATDCAYFAKITPYPDETGSALIEKSVVQSEWNGSNWFDVLRIMAPANQGRNLRVKVRVFKVAGAGSQPVVDPAVIRSQVSFPTTLEPGTWHGWVLGNTRTDAGYLVKVTPNTIATNRPVLLEKVVVQSEWNGSVWRDVLRIMSPTNQTALPVQVRVFQVAPRQPGDNPATFASIKQIRSMPASFEPGIWHGYAMAQSSSDRAYLSKITPLVGQTQAPPLEKVTFQSEWNGSVWNDVLRVMSPAGAAGWDGHISVFEVQP